MKFKLVATVEVVLDVDSEEVLDARDLFMAQDILNIHMENLLENEVELDMLKDSISDNTGWNLKGVKVALSSGNSILKTLAEKR